MKTLAPEALLVAAARRVLRPTLDRPRQYAPRTLHATAGNEEEKPAADAPSFAIVTPSLNQGQYIAAAIDSVLGQRYPRLSYVVVDGGSTDETRATLARYGDRLRWLSEADRGQADALNKGFSLIDGQIMGWLNSDDLWLPGLLARVARYFADHAGIDMVYGHRIFVDEAGRETGRAVLPPHDGRALAFLDFVPQESLFWRRAVWDAVGPLDASLQFTIDWDFVLRAADAGFRFARIPRFLGCFRVHEDQKTALLAGIGRDEAYLLRQRRFGRQLEDWELSRGVRRYMLGQAIWQWLYRAGLPVAD